MTDETRDRALLEGVRHGLLMIVDAIERWLESSPRTAELRAWYKAGRLR